MKNILLIYLFLFITGVSFGQVGIGTTEPSAELEINATTNLPALQLTPQATPMGTNTGQIAVIGDQLFLYDESRGKWLSVESTVFNFGNENATDNRFLEYVGDIINTGAIAPYDGTIVYVSIKHTEASPVVKDFQIYIDDVPVPDANPINATAISTDGVLTTLTATQTFLSRTHNIDIAQGQSLRVRVAAAGNPVQNPTVLLWVKWRR